MNSKIFLSIVILLSVFIVVYCMQYVTQVRNSFVIPYLKSFLTPEHGRWIASFLANFLIEKLPCLLKLHYNDLFLYIILFVSVPINLSVLLLISKSFFAFELKKKNYILFSVTYFLLFLLFFNQNIDGYNFMGFEETVELLEYNFPLIFYLLFCLFFIKYFIKEKVPDKKNYIIAIVLIFLTGISTETQNLFFLTFWGMINLYSIGKCLFKKSKRNIKFLKFIFVLDFVYAVSLLAYYIHPADHMIVFTNNNENFLKEFSEQFILWVIQPFFILPLISVCSCFLIFILKNRHRIVDCRIITFSLMNLFSLYFFFFMGNFLIMSVWCSSDRYYLFHDKFIFVFLIFLTFNITLTLGYLLDTKFENKKSILIKSLILLSVFIFCKDIHPITYYSAINERRTFLYEKRLLEYKLLKIFSTPRNQSEYFIPNYADDYKYYDIAIDEIFSNLSVITGEFKNTKRIILSSSSEFLPLSKEEQKNLRFSHIVVPKPWIFDEPHPKFSQEQVIYR